MFYFEKKYNSLIKLYFYTKPNVIFNFTSSIFNKINFLRKLKINVYLNKNFNKIESVVVRIKFFIEFIIKQIIRTYFSFYNFYAYLI